MGATHRDLSYFYYGHPESISTNDSYSSLVRMQLRAFSYNMLCADQGGPVAESRAQLNSVSFVGTVGTGPDKPP